MKPFFFGGASRPLFGICHEPPEHLARNRGVVICAPVGQEYMRSHRALRLLAADLARSGFHALRFDYFGCGDSAGEGDQGDLDRWQQDVGEAIDELEAWADLEQVSVVGARLGGSLAALVAAGRGDVDRLVLWEPIVTGADHLRELATLHGELVLDTIPDPPPATGQEALGFPLSPGFRSHLAAMDLASLDGCRAHRALLIETLSDGGRLNDRLRAIGLSVEYDRIDAPRVWFKQPGIAKALVPNAVIDRIVGWLTERAA